MHNKQPLKPRLYELYDAITPYASGFLPVEQPHELYWEQCGNPDGIPILFIHGGPGGGCSPKHRQYFDPNHYRIILFDQRGAGRSTPLACLENNTTKHLISDIEKLRQHLSIDKWHIFGGSWGSTLALAYASEHANRCISMILRGIFLMEEAEIEWFLYGVKNIFPEAWEQFAEIIPAEKHDDLLNAYYEIFTTGTMDEQIEAAMRWSLYESSFASLIPNYETITTDNQKAQALCIAKIECHYFKTQVVKKEDSLLNKVNNFRHVPTVIVQGRYDIVCPITTAHALHNAWPEADYIVVPDAGHSSSDKGIRSRLIEATENAKTIL